MNIEYLWLAIVAIGAGVGAGLAGLSAATVMVRSSLRSACVYR